MINDRRQGVTEGTAFKTPCRAATTANITLAGEQTIDGVAIVDGDRVLVKEQSTASENGIYECDTGTWTRTRDCDGARDLVTGTLVRVTGGTANKGIFELTTTGTITVGTTSIAFAIISNELLGVSDLVHAALDESTPIDFFRVLGTTGTQLCTVSGTSNAIVFTPLVGAVSTLQDGDIFTGIPNFTTDTSSTITVRVVGTTAKILKAPDGYTYALWYDVQKNKPLTVRYAAAQDVFVIQSPPLSFKQSIFGNGRVKTQSNSSQELALTQDDGQSLLVFNSTAASFRMIACPTIIKTNLFAAQNYVEGVANQALSNNQLYAVYVFNTDGTNDQAVDLDFYRMYTGVGSEAWTPTINELGIYVKRSAIGATTSDNTRSYVGMMWTAGGDISTVLTGPVLQSVVQSHYNLWPFPMMSDVVSVTGVTTATTALQSSPRATVVSEGIQHCPIFKLHANVRNNTINQMCSIQISVSGTSYNGTAFSATSPIAKATSSTVNAWNNLYCEWGVAVPMGVFTAQPLIAVDGGTGEFELDMQVLFAN